MNARIWIAPLLAFTLSACVQTRIQPPPCGVELAPGDFHADDLTPLKSLRILSPQPFQVVGGGTSVPIIVEDDPRCISAALSLSDTIRRMTGVRAEILRVFSGHEVPKGPAFFVGNKVAASENVKPPAGPAGSFRVVAHEGSVRFLGDCDFAVHDWCERQLGIRCYGPDETDFYVPSCRGLAVLAVDYSDSPVFAHRDFGGVGRERWGRFGKTGPSARAFPRVHAPTTWREDGAPAEIFSRSADGSRGGTPMLCYGSPATLEYYKKRIDGHIRDGLDSGGIVDTRSKTISVSQWDAFLDCSCGHCRALLDPSAPAGGYGSRVIWGWFLPRLARWVREAHPEYTISFLPYWNTCDVPGELNLRRFGNCEATVCVMPGLAMLKDKATRVEEEERIRAWRRATGHLPLLWHYSCWPAEYTVAPYVYGETIRRHFRSMRGDIDGAFVCMGHERFRQSLSLYVWMRCMWNPDLDVQALYDGYAERLFGPCAAQVRELIRLCEEGWMRKWPHARICDASVFGISYPREEVLAMRSLLNEAKRLAADDAALQCRLSRLERGFSAFFLRAEEFAKGVRKELVPVPRSSVPPAVDGVLDDECWRMSSARNFVEAFTGREPWAPTAAQVLWTREGVFFGFSCREPAENFVRSDAAQGDFLRQDTLNVLFDATGTDRGVCRRVMIDIRNRVSAFADSVPCSAQGVRSAVHLGDGFWSAEIYLPFSAFAGVEIPREGTIWKINLIRGRIGDSWRKREERLPGSRAEISRLSTRLSPLNTDRDAFLPFCFAGGGKNL